MASSPAALKTAEDESDALLEDIANITIEAERLGGEIHQLLEVRLEGVLCAVTEAFLVPDDCITSRPFAHAHHHCLTSCPFCLPFVVSSGISLSPRHSCCRLVRLFSDGRPPCPLLPSLYSLLLPTTHLYTGCGAEEGPADGEAEPDQSEGRSLHGAARTAERIAY